MAPRLGPVGQSWRLLRSHKGLLGFPVLGALLALLLVAPPAVAGGYFLDEGDTALGVVLLAVAVYLGSFITAYMGVGLAAAVDAALRDSPRPRPGPAGGLVALGGDQRLGAAHGGALGVAARSRAAASWPR